MPWWIIVLAGFGGIVLAAAIVVGIFGVVQGFREHNRKEAFALGRQHEMDKWRMNADWFSEDPDTVKLLKEFATMDVSKAREDWRHRRASKVPPLPLAERGRCFCRCHAADYRQPSCERGCDVTMTGVSCPLAIASKS